VNQEVLGDLEALAVPEVLQLPQECLVDLADLLDPVDPVDPEGLMVRVDLEGRADQEDLQQHLECLAALVDHLDQEDLEVLEDLVDPQLVLVNQEVREDLGVLVDLGGLEEMEKMETA